MDHIEKRIIEEIDKHREDIIAMGRDIFCNAELGYKEFETAKKFVNHMQALGLETKSELAITGAKGYLKDEKTSGRTIALIGELDALPISDSPSVNKATGAAHCCGHNAQMAGIMGAAFALTVPEVKEALDGNVVFFAVPAEEFVEVEFKNNLMKEGKIKYGGGKSELIRIGEFDEIDISVCHHTQPSVDITMSNYPSNGFFNKMIHFQGVPAHAAGAPHLGVDAYSASTLFASCLNANRESFKDDDTVRIHGFLSKGAEAMNIIADSTTMEYSVRANNIPAILDASKKVDRSIRAAAIATGCGATITTMPGYLPVVPVADCKAVEETFDLVKGDYKIAPHVPGFIMGGSTDCGDVSQIMPLLTFQTGGYDKILHDKETKPVDEELAYVITAKIFALTAYNLLKNGGQYSEDLISGFTPLLTKEEYIKYMDDSNSVVEIPMEA